MELLFCFSPNDDDLFDARHCIECLPFCQNQACQGLSKDVKVTRDANRKLTKNMIKWHNWAI